MFEGHKITDDNQKYATVIGALDAATITDIAFLLNKAQT